MSKKDKAEPVKDGGPLIPVKNLKGLEIWINPLHVVRATETEGYVELAFSDGQIVRAVDFKLSDLSK